MSIRTERVGNVIRGIVAEAILSRLNDPRIEPLTSVTYVDLTPDFAVAHIHVSVMAPPAKQRATLAGLTAARSRLRGFVKQGLATRTIPQLEFHLDESVQRSLETISQIDSLMQPIENPLPPAAGADEPDRNLEDLAADPLPDADPVPEDEEYEIR